LQQINTTDLKMYNRHTGKCRTYN